MLYRHANKRLARLEEDPAMSADERFTYEVSRVGRGASVWICGDPSEVLRAAPRLPPGRYLIREHRAGREPLDWATIEVTEDGHWTVGRHDGTQVRG